MINKSEVKEVVEAVRRWILNGSNISGKVNSTEITIHEGAVNDIVVISHGFSRDGVLIEVEVNGDVKICGVEKETEGDDFAREFLLEYYGWQ